MSTAYKTYSFPSFPISKQLFHVPGQAYDGGLTAGGARISSPEPGGFSMLEIQPAMQVDEWNFPISSWLMSKTNGQIFTVRLAPTPQIAQQLIGGSEPWAAGTGYPSLPWSNLENWAGDLVAHYSAISLQSSNVIVIDMSVTGRILQPGHVIGHKQITYLVDEISYNNANVATITVTPPVRTPIAVGDIAYFRPWFTGVISNPSEFITTYDAANAGNIQLNRIVLNEVVLP